MSRSLLVTPFLVLSVACGPEVSPCRVDGDCPGTTVCRSSECLMPVDLSAADAGRQMQPADASVIVHDAGVTPVPDAGVDAGSDAGIDGGVDGGLDAGEMLQVDAGMVCMPIRCSDVGATCGAVSDGCGGMLSCGTCSAPQSCGALAPNECGCQPKTCAQLGARCGTNVPDGCGGTIPSCGPAPDCGGGQWSCDSSYSCQCAPKTCSSLGATCGQNIADGCGGFIPYCGAALSCGGGQMYCDQSVNRCACQPKTCASLGAVCGTNIPDGCGGTISSCGVGTNCGNFKTCGASLTCVCTSSVDVPDDQFADTNCDGIDGDASQAIFVSPNGSDVNPGSKAAPVQTLARARFMVAMTGKMQIYIASGSYAVGASDWLPGVSLYGGYDALWNRSSDINARAVLNVPSTGMSIQRLSSPTVIENIVIQSAAGSAGAASQALRVANSGTYLTLRNVKLVAGLGGPGAAGVPGSNGPAGERGQPGQAAALHQPNRIAAGGLGGIGAANAGASGGRGGSDSATLQGETGNGLSPGFGGSAGCPVAVPGLPGQIGAFHGNAPEGAANSTGPGSLSAEGFWVSPGPGATGQTGPAGSGGNGGGGGGMVSCFAGAREPGGGGGGGGSGGLGGYGGSGGWAGGASIALVLIASNPAMTNVSFHTAGGGAGGLGAAGGNGGIGGAGGVGGANVSFNDFLSTITSGAGGNGGWGGTGGKGGTGGNGAPGASFGVWCSGVVGLSYGGPVVLGAAGVTGGVIGLRANTWGC